ncbi:MAG: sulfite exporter TauE/SafE family protein [Saprospiraceae bacterium]|nr:sulfite exporter TauE/SafE family protein [Saprospiraceae bacterium]
MCSETLQLALLFLGVSAIYASVGFGGGSSYLAVLSLFAIPMTAMRSTSLMCNIIVVAGGTYIYWQNGYFNLKKMLPLVAASVPLAFIGGMTPIKERVFFLLLGCCLVVAALLMLLQNMFLKKNNVENSLNDTNEFSPVKNALLGGGIGLLSGVVGIGGGIFLSPVLNLSRWDTPKNVAATASFFILTNSIAGLAGQFWQHRFATDWSLGLSLLLAVFIGGQVGSRFSALKINALHVRQVTAALVFYAGANILWTHF